MRLLEKVSEMLEEATEFDEWTTASPFLAKQMMTLILLMVVVAAVIKWRKMIQEKERMMIQEKKVMTESVRVSKERLVEPDKALLGAVSWPGDSRQ